MLYWDPVVNHWVVLLSHVLFEFVDYLQHLFDVSRVRFVSLSSLLSCGINLHNLLIALHASVKKGHGSPSITTSSGEIRRFELRIFNVDGKLCIKLIFAYSRPWTLCFTHSGIQKAKLMPDHTMDLDHYRIVPIIGTVSIESHASCKIDS